MAPRASWKGFLNLSLVSVPVKAYSATDSSGTIRLNQLHQECGSRIKLNTVCPGCGDISRKDIVKGYEFAKDQYVVIDLEELQKLRADDDSRAIRIHKFVSPNEVDPIYFSESSYFLVPDGVPGQKPFALLYEAMIRKELVCIAQIVLHNKEQLVLVRPFDDLLCMTVLRFAAQIKAIGQFTEEMTQHEISDEEFALAETLIKETTSDSFQIEEFQDEYTIKLQQLIDSKVEGRELVEPPSSAPTPAINLMEALKASVAQVRNTEAKPPTKRKVAKRGKAPAKTKKKKAATKKSKKKSASKKAVKKKAK